MLRLYMTIGSQEYDVTNYVDQKTIKISERINIPSQMTFSLHGYDKQFPIPVMHAYVRLYSVNNARSLFTGFIATEPDRQFLGLSMGVPQESKGQELQYDVIVTSDELLLNIKSVPFVPAFINQTQGYILRNLAELLCPGFFDTSAIQDGDVVPYFDYDPSKSWCEIAKQFADGSRYRYKARDKRIWYAPYDDGPLGIRYDEEKLQRSFDPFQLKTQVLAVPIVNDLTVIGAAEAGNSHDDFFLGDGFTGNFSLRHKMFNGASSILLQESFGGGSLNGQTWAELDPGTNFDFSAGAFNMITGVPNGFGTSYLLAKNGLELAGGLDLEHGEWSFNDVCDGIIGGLYTDTTMGTLLGGFRITSPTGVDVSSSGAAGIVIQPEWAGNPVGEAIVTQQNHTYVLQTVIAAAAYSRYKQAYRTLDGSVYGAAQQNTIGDVLFIVQDYDIAAATGFYYQPTITKYAVGAQAVPSFASYAVVDNNQMNATCRFVTIARMPLGALDAYTGSTGLQYPSGAILPWLPPGSGGFVGTVSPWPSQASGGIMYPPGVLQGWVSEVLGNGFQLQVAQITAGNEVDTLAFYPDSLPAAGVLVHLRSWESQAALSRLQASGSIANEAAVVGDDGLRAAIISNLQPLPRTSEDCDNAALAFLHDRTGVYYNGAYTCTSYFIDQLTNDEQFYPTPGRFLFINAPARRIVKEEMLVSGVDYSVADLAGEVLVIQLSFGADMYLEKCLLNFVEVPMPNILSPTDKANPPEPRYTVDAESSYLADIQYISASFPDDNTVVLSILDEVKPAPIEVRRIDANWGRGATADYIGTFTSGMMLSRSQFEQQWFMRYVGSATNKSRRSKVVRVYMAQTPSAPILLAVDSNFLQLDYDGDQRNLNIVEIRAADNATVVFQEPYAFVLGLGIDWTQTPYTYGALAGTRTFYVYFANQRWSYSAPLVVTIPAPPAPNVTATTKLGTQVEIDLDQIDRSDIANTTLQYSTDASFVTDVTTITQPGQPGKLTFAVRDSLSDWYFRVKRSDLIGDSAWSATATLTRGSLINTGFLRGQGGIIKTLDNQVSPLFSYTAFAQNPDTDSSEFALSWTDFMLVYGDDTLAVPDRQLVASGAYATGPHVFATSHTIDYAFYPVVQPIDGSAVQFISASGKAWFSTDPTSPDWPNNVLAAQLAQQDGWVDLAGSALSFLCTMPIAPPTGGTGGGGGGGGNQCVVEGSMVTAAGRGLIVAEAAHVQEFLKGADPVVRREVWDEIDLIASAEEECVAIELENGAVLRVSASSYQPVAVPDVSGRMKGWKVCQHRAKTITTQHSMFAEALWDWCRVRSVQSIGTQRVVRLRLRPRAWFFVDGVLSHNYSKL